MRLDYDVEKDTGWRKRKRKLTVRGEYRRDVGVTLMAKNFYKLQILRFLEPSWVQLLFL